MARVKTDFTEIPAAVEGTSVADYTAYLPMDDTHPVEWFYRTSKARHANLEELWFSLAFNVVTGWAYPATDEAFPNIVYPSGLSVATQDNIGASYDLALVQYSGQTAWRQDRLIHTGTKPVLELWKQDTDYSSSFYGSIGEYTEVVVKGVFNQHGGNGDGYYAYDYIKQPNSYMYCGFRPSDTFPDTATFVNNWGGLKSSYMEMQASGTFDTASPPDSAFAMGIMKTSAMAKTVAELTPADFLLGVLSVGALVRFCVNGTVLHSYTMAASNTRRTLNIEANSSYDGSGELYPLASLEATTLSYITFVVSGVSGVLNNVTFNTVTLAPQIDCVYGYRSDMNLTPFIGSNDRWLVFMRNSFNSPEQGALKAFYYSTPYGEFWEEVRGAVEV